MALQVWLPLNKNGADKNQGLGDSIIANFGAVYESSGKLGGCYKCTKSAGIQIESKPWMKMVPGNSFSVSMWIKGCSGNTWVIACTSWELNFRTSVLSVYPGGSISNGGCAIYQTFDNDTWYHIAFSYNGDTSKLSLYLNGEFKQEYVTTYTKEGIASTITLPYGDTRYINDFRIYDHCLSPKEVKEISKGLVLHYPLNDAYVQSTTNLNKSIGTSWSNWGESTITSNSFISPEGTIGSHVNCSSYTGGGIYVSHSDFSVKPDTTYVISAKMKLTGNTHKNLFCIYEYDSANTNLSAGGKWSSSNAIEYRNGYKLYYGIFTTASTASKVSLFSYFYNVGEHWIYDIQVEEGTYPTPFAGYNASRTATTVYDCSGYQNNGTITGALSCSTDSPRYKISTHFTSSIPSRIMLPSDMSCLSGNNEQTLSCWVKSSGLGSGMRWSGLISLGYGNTLFLNSSDYCYVIDNGSDFISLYANQNPHDGNWHLVTATYKSGVASIYIDGILKNSVSRTFSNRYINKGANCIGTEVNNSSIYNLNGDISDVRMYATALSGEDIKELYNTSAYVLDNGTLLTYSVEE